MGRYNDRPQMAVRLDSIATRRLAALAAGALAWPLLNLALPLLPTPIRFLIAWFLFTFGPGVAIAGRLTRDLDGLRRVIVILGAGSAATPVLIDVLGRAHLVAAFPYLAAGLAIAGIVLAVGRPSGDAVP